MSDTVIPFRKREEPTIGGAAVCTACRHEWEAVAPIGTAWLECPSCGAHRGTWKHPIGPQVGDLAFFCMCGSDALTAYQHAGKFWLRCIACGTDQTEAIFG